MVANRNNEQQLDVKLSKSDVDVKQSVANRRRLSANLTLTKAHLQLKQKEEGRQKITTDTRLRNNIIEQKILNDLSQQLELEDKSRQIHDNIQAHESRRVQKSTESNDNVKTKQIQHEVIYSSKFNKKLIDQRRRIHEDHLKHFQKMVGKGESAEYSLHGIVRTSEYARKQQQRKVRQLHLKLCDLKRKNTKEIREKIIVLSHEEKGLEQQLQREKAQLDKVHAQREETYLVLQHHRHNLRNDRYLFDEHLREHSRLMRVGQKSSTHMLNTI